MGDARAVCRGGGLDEDALLKGLGARNYAEVVRRHRNSFITRDDFVRIASRGFNAVRLPVPWYAFGDGAAQTIGFVGCMEHVDDALDWAEELGLDDPAINPGGPGRGGEATHDLADMRLSRERALDVVFRLSKRYASRMGFFGIELADDVVSQRRLGLTLTEGMPVHLLRNYYREAYELVRHAAGEEPVVIMPDGGIPGGWGRFMAQRHYRNVWLDCHLDRRPTTRVDVSGPSGVRRLVERNSRQLREAARAGMPVMVGKWSAALPIADSAMTPEGRIALERVFTSEQIAAYEKAPAWFFNTWKTGPAARLGRARGNGDLRAGDDRLMTGMLSMVARPSETYRTPRRAWSPRWTQPTSCCARTPASRASSWPPLASTRTWSAATRTSSSSASPQCWTACGWGSAWRLSPTRACQASPTRASAWWTPPLTRAFGRGGHPRPLCRDLRAASRPGERALLLRASCPGASPPR